MKRTLSHSMSADDLKAWLDHMARANGWNKADACRALGASRSGLDKWLKHGAPFYIGLACKALLHGLRPYWKGDVAMDVVPRPGRFHIVKGPREPRGDYFDQ